MQTVPSSFLPADPSRTATGSGRKKRLRSMFMTALSIVLFVLARIAAAGLSPTADAEILLAGDTVTGDAAEEMRMLEKQQDSPLLFTLWEEEKDALVENTAWDRQENVSALLLNGDSESAF